MKKKYNTDPNIEQNKASEPNTSVWVNASAGSGKTKVLIDRILRLLLNNVNPSEILCITFTKAATSVIKNRIINALSTWSYISEEELIKNIEKLTNIVPNKNTLLHARCLCNKVLDSTSGIKIQTIHSFCQSILSYARIEGNVINTFNLIDDNNQISIDIKKNISHYILNLLVNDTKLNKEILLYYFNESNFKQLISDILKYEKELDILSNKYTNFKELKNIIYEIFEANTDEKYRSYKIKNCNNNKFNFKGFKELLNILKSNNIVSYKRKNIVEIINNWLHLSDAERASNNNFDSWYNLFFTKNTPRENIIPNDIKKTLPFHLKDLFNEEILRLSELTKSLKNIATAEVNFEFLKLSFYIKNEYKKQKELLQVFDYNQLLTETAKLLQKPRLFSWIAYKLDQKISHILIDEAQDTSKEQWDIIQQILFELFGNNNSISNSLFVVGDIKQSIYGFQGANPIALKDTKANIKDLIINNNYKWHEANLNVSFRSSPSIIKGVNNIIKNLFNTNDNIYKDEKLEHYSYNQSQPGLLEIWPLVIADTEDPLLNQHILLANAIAKKIEHLIFIEKFNPSDIMILFKKRQNNKTINELIKLLQNKNIPVSGLDKIALNSHIITMDIISIAKFIIEPLDNFNLSCLLKSPIFNFTDTDLENLIFHNNKKFLWENLNKSEEKFVIYAKQKLIEWLNIGNTVSLFDLFIRILYKDGVYETFLSTFGNEINNILTEFINFVLSFEKTNKNPSLEQFVNLIENIDPVIKKDFDGTDNIIKFMTIHNSKGLEEKIVFLIDNVNNKNQEDTIIKSSLYKDFIFMKPNKKYMNHIMEKETNLIKEKENAETKRLLYVAITRAKERLYICANCKSIPKETSETEYKSNSIYQLIVNNVIKSEFNLCNNKFFTDKKGFCNDSFLQLENNLVTSQDNSNIKDAKVKIPLPSWVSKSIKQTLVTKTTATNNSLLKENYNNSFFNKNKINPKTIGTVVHTIIEYAPNIYNIKQQKDFIENILNNQLPQLNNKSKINIIKKLTNILHDNKYNFIFKSQNSYSELSINSILEDENISSRIDKIIFIDNKVFIIDYKFSSFSKDSIAAYSKQLEIYKSIIRKLYPEKDIIAFIFFLGSQDLIKI